MNYLPVIIQLYSSMVRVNHYNAHASTTAGSRERFITPSRRPAQADPLCEKHRMARNHDGGEAMQQEVISGVAGGSMLFGKHFPNPPFRPPCGVFRSQEFAR